MVIYEIWFDYESYIVDVNGLSDSIKHFDKLGYELHKQYNISGCLNLEISGATYAERKQNAKEKLDYYYTNLWFDNIDNQTLESIIKHWLDTTIKRYGLTNYCIEQKYI